MRALSRCGWAGVVLVSLGVTLELAVWAGESRGSTVTDGLGAVVGPARAGYVVPGEGKGSGMGLSVSGRMDAGATLRGLIAPAPMPTAAGGGLVCLGLLAWVRGLSRC